MKLAQAQTLLARIISLIHLIQHLDLVARNEIRSLIINEPFNFILGVAESAVHILLGPMQPPVIKLEVLVNLLLVSFEYLIRVHLRRLVVVDVSVRPPILVPVVRSVLSALEHDAFESLIRRSGSILLYQLLIGQPGVTIAESTTASCSF